VSFVSQISLMTLQPMVVILTQAAVRRRLYAGCHP
jgi:hypothetical protein